MIQETAQLRTEVTDALDILLPVLEDLNKGIKHKDLTVDEVVTGIIGIYRVKRKPLPGEIAVRKELPALMEQRGYRVEYSEVYQENVFHKVA